MSIFIFDFDGTISLPGERIQLLSNLNDPDRWDKFYQACDQDAPNYAVIDILNALLSAGHKILIFTGRREFVREKSINFLLKYTELTRDQLHESDLRMRPEGNDMKDDQLKEMWLKEMYDEDRVQIKCVFEDRSRVVDMWRRNGVPCFQVSEGDF